MLLYISTIHGILFTGVETKSTAWVQWGCQ